MRLFAAFLLCLAAMASSADVLTAEQNGSQKKRYVITCDGQVIGFTTDTSYDYSSTATYQVQAVNEYGGLSKKATAGVLTSINQLNSPLSGELEGSSSAIYTLDGRRTTTLQRGINIIHHQSTDGKSITKKIVY